MLLITDACERKALVHHAGETKQRRIPPTRRPLLVLALTAAALVVLRQTSLEGAEVPAELTWYKGVVHAHANWGAPQLPTTSPDVVVRWYREHNYNFVSVTDLNYYTPPEGLKALFDAPGRFLVVPGTEPSKEPIQPGNKIVDTIGIGIKGPVDAPTGDTVAKVLDSEAKAIRRKGGLPIAAHPNLTYAVTATDLLASDQTPGPRFFEVWNTEPGMNNLGGGGKPSTEQIWDEVLSAGRTMYAVAVDDSHHFYEFVSSRQAGSPLSNPGKAWIEVRASELSVPALLEAMKRGDFYATTGVILASYEATPAAIRIGLSDHTRDLGWSLPGANPQLYRTEFIGKGGKLLKLDESLNPAYEFTGSELYVRARITNSDGQVAWTQPVFRK
ncbi:MAG TPA: CehA/McbA family metallohydrolase [Candidatus Binatia bacterium]|nr:CehA/McbA family metallohydrolase [Candidatus Binatia bacterium]